MTNPDLPSHPLLHIAPSEAWTTAANDSSGSYVDPSLGAEGFIHLSTPDQVLIPANERFAGRTDLALLVIDPEALHDPVVFEDCYDSGLAFPHLYGPLPVAAVTTVLPFLPNEDGTFALPAELQYPDS